MTKDRKRWDVAVSHEQMMKENPVAEQMIEVLGVVRPTAYLLIRRGCKNPEDAYGFLMKETEWLHDPFLMKDMEQAVERILTALENQEKIVIYGDYDVDGVTSVSILYLYLQAHDGDVGYFIPSRSGEGYGMTEGAVQKLADGGASLLVTVDTGITAVKEAAFARSIGLDLIVTDHHECQEELPDAVAVVNPKRPDCDYPFKELAGVGVVFKLLCALESALHPDDDFIDCVRRVSKEYGDLVAVGTVADVMPVIDENRLIISYGLSLIEQNVRPGLTELINASKSDTKSGGKKKITASFIGYTIAPRVNAAGRLRDASLAVELFLAPDAQTAAPIAKELCDINRERQNEENKIVEEAYAAIAAGQDFDRDPVIVVENDTWHHGVIGIVASRVTEKFGRPSILVSFEGQENMGKGSGRSVKGINLVEALASCSDLLEKFGGHELAAGLTIRRENLDEFKRRINDYARERFGATKQSPSLEADCELWPEDITMELARELSFMEPYGVANPMPTFVLYDALVADVVSVGAGKHTRLTLRVGASPVTAMCFRCTASELDLYPGDRVDVMFGLDINDFMNQRSLQMIVKDIRLTKRLYEREVAEHLRYGQLCASLQTEEQECRLLGGGPVTQGGDASPSWDDPEGDGFSGDVPEDILPGEADLPDRRDFVCVYSTLRRELRTEHEVFSVRALRHLLAKEGTPLPYTKLMAILSICGEMGLLRVRELDAEREIYAFGYIQVREKVDLEQSALLQAMRKTVRERKTHE